MGRKMTRSGTCYANRGTPRTITKRRLLRASQSSSIRLSGSMHWPPSAILREVKRNAEGIDADDGGHALAINARLPFRIVVTEPLVDGANGDVFAFATSAVLQPGCNARSRDHDRDCPMPSGSGNQNGRRLDLQNEACPCYKRLRPRQRASRRCSSTFITGRMAG